MFPILSKQNKYLYSIMSEKENLPLLFTIKKGHRTKKDLTRSSSKQFPSVKHIAREKLNKTNDYDHPAEKFLFATSPSSQQFRKFATMLYQGLAYATCALKGPSEEYLRKKSLKLPERKQSKKKFLMLDLDETLIHSLWGNESCQVSISKGETNLRFNIRPHCLSFLQNMSNHFEVFIFTASTIEYAETIVNYLNSKKHTIQGILSRTNCLETLNGLKIKDLRIIKNRSLSDIVIVDNLVHSFGLQIDNGIPILDFTDNKEDKELVGLEKLLLELKDAVDVRDFIRNKVSLRKCLQICQEQFLSFGTRKNIKKA